MLLHSVKMTADGRIQIPIQIRRQMGLNGGDTLNLELHDGQLSLRRSSKTLKRIRAKLSPDQRKFGTSRWHTPANRQFPRGLGSGCRCI